MKPFPTSFWLVCPFLLRAIGKIESGGGIAEMKGESRESADEWREYHLFHALIRLSMLGGAQRAYLRSRRRPIYRAICAGGAGGSAYSRDPIAVKCLHLHVASYMALGYHPMSDWLSSRVSEWECGAALCRGAS
jgi:hypothetical protein